jgi:hypothetical protein
MVAKNNNYTVPGTMEGADGRVGYGSAGDIWITLYQASALMGLGPKMVMRIAEAGDLVMDREGRRGAKKTGTGAKFRFSLRSVEDLKKRHAEGTYVVPFARNGWGVTRAGGKKGHPHSGNALLRKKVDNLEGMMRQLLSALAPKEEPPTP